MNRERKKPRTTSTNAATTRRPFTHGRERAILPIPQIIDNYNHNMNGLGVDRADQLRASYSTQLKALRNWLPLFFWILDTSIVNAFILFKFFHPNTTHSQFRLDLAKSLVKASTNIVTPVYTKPINRKLKRSTFLSTIIPFPRLPQDLITLFTYLQASVLPVFSVAFH